jgi:hypothetical protein
MPSTRPTLSADKQARLRELAGTMLPPDIAAELGCSLAVLRNNACALKVSLKAPGVARVQRVTPIDRFLRRA